MSVSSGRFARRLGRGGVVLVAVIAALLAASCRSEGPQPESGDGWRLLGSERTGQAYRTGVATTDEQYRTLWAASMLSADRPAVSLETEIVIWFGTVYGGGCENRLDGVVFDQERSIVHGDLVIPGSPEACRADANPKAYVVAVDRDRLPPSPFFVQLEATDPPSGEPQERTVVSADLRPPGAVARADQIETEAELERD